MLNRLQIKGVVLFLAFALPLAFACYTNHIWEDYFITLRSSRNLVEGHGLVFNPGEHLQTYTSPLGVLVPAFCYWLAGDLHETATIWIFRLINSALLAGAAALVWDTLVRLRIGTLARTLFFGLILADGKLADFSTNGMETAMLVFFVVLLWSELTRPEGFRLGMLALACAGLEWTRPDAFIIGLALILPHLIFRSVPSGMLLTLKRLLQAGALAVSLYLPWFFWTWWYYGTPIPHTIVAKSQFTLPFHFSELLLIPWHTLRGDSLLVDLFLPAYWTFGGWPALLRYFSQGLVLVAAFAWAVPLLPAVARRASLTVFLGMFYVCSIILYPWYTPPWTVLAALAVSLTVDTLAGFAAASRRKWMLPTLRVAILTAIVLQVGMLAATAWEMKIQQTIIEDQVRRDIGHWLHEQAKPADTVFLEPLGYIGYFSGLKAYDVPGLSSPEVVAVVRSGHRRVSEIIAQVRPVWLVVRPYEFADPALSENAALRNYERVRVWDVRPQLDAIGWLPGRQWMEYDAVFHVYHLKPAPGM